MEDVKLLVTCAQRGDIDAFEMLVRRFQDMAVGYAYSLLRDFHLAEDASQEAFIGAFQDLSSLRAPEAFPAWFRQIVFKHCDRLTRGRRVSTAPLEAIAEMPSGEKDPAETLEEREMQDWVLDAVEALPEDERTVTTLFYISEYSHTQIAGFLGLPMATVNNRLRAARKRLKMRMLNMAKQRLHEGAPSRNTEFKEKVLRMIRPEELKSEQFYEWSGGRGTDVWEMICAAITGDLDTIKRLVEKEPTLVNCSYQSRTPLHFAVRENQRAVVEFLMDAGVDATSRSGNPWHELPLVIAQDRGYGELAAFLEARLKRDHQINQEGEEVAEVIRQRDLTRVKAMLDRSPELIRATDGRGNQPLHWAVMTRQMKLIDEMLRQGADINARRPDGARPLDLTNGDYWYRGWRHVPREALQNHAVLIGYLLAKGADYDISVAAKLGDAERVRELLSKDPELANRVPSYSTYYSGLPLPNAAGGHLEVVKTLLEAGADPNTPEPGLAPRGRALHAAAAGGNLEIAKLLLEAGADPNQDVDSSWNCCSIAWTQKHLEMIKLLASYGGKFHEDMNLKDKDADILKLMYGDDLPLRYYVDTGDVDTLKAKLETDLGLVREVFDLAVEKYDIYGESIQEDVAKLCLKYDPDGVKRFNNFGFTRSLVRRRSPKMLDAARLLFEHGMNPNASDWLRVTPLHVFAMHGYGEGAALFIEYGADLHARDEEYLSTPLGWAARWGQKEMVERLLEKGAAVNLPDDPPWATPLAWAEKKARAPVPPMNPGGGPRPDHWQPEKQKDYEEIAEILRKRGAKA